MKLSTQIIKNKKGFTLIELLVVIGILAVLLAITLIAINPARQFAQANNTKRTSDVNAILNAINQYMADNKGAEPTGVTATLQNISSGGANICALLVPTYIASLPSDPKTGIGAGSISLAGCAETYDTKYQVMKTAEGRVTVKALEPELSTPIEVSR